MVAGAALLLVLAGSLGSSEPPQVPGVVGERYERAAELLREKGYRPVRGDTLNAGGRDCAVYRQRPAPYSAVAAGATVRLDVDCAFVRY